MRKWHNRLNDRNFKNSRYIKAIEEELNISNFRKNYPEHYKFILDTLQTLILINNSLFADSNLSKYDKVKNANYVMEKYLFVDYENSDKKRYSVRFVKEIIDKHCRYLNKKINEWYNDTKYTKEKTIDDSYLINNVLNEIEEEMDKLIYVNFDEIVVENKLFETIKNPNHQIYISKFLTDKNFKDSYCKQYFDNYGYQLNQNDITTISLIYNILANINNGIVKIINNIPNQNYSINTTAQELIIQQLKFYNIKVNYNIVNINDRLFKKELEKIYNFLNSKYSLTFCEISNNYDLYNFIYTMENENFFNNNKAILENLFFSKLVSDLKEIYFELIEIISSTNKESLLNLYNKTKIIIERNIDLFEIN